jgi:hypothetical protein
VGFVLGARAGRQTYDKVRDQSLELWHNPTVQEKVSGATETVKDKAPKLQHKVGALAKKAAHHGADGETAPAEEPLEEAAGQTPAAEPTGSTPKSTP